MDASIQEELTLMGKHFLHGAEDTLDVVGHGLAGRAQGVADGVKKCSRPVRGFRAVLTAHFTIAVSPIRPEKPQGLLTHNSESITEPEASRCAIAAARDS